MRAQALSAATGQAVAAVSTLESRASARGLDLSLQWSAHAQDGSLLAAAVAVPAPGRTAAMLFSVGSQPDHAVLTGRVLDAAARDLVADRRLALLQCLPRPGEEARARALTAGGFRRLARLDYMERTNAPARSPEPMHLPSAFTLAPWLSTQPELLIALLQRTFEGTLDCPGLADMRTGPDILDGHLQSGDGDTSLWRVLRMDDVPVGAMLLSPCAATDSVDLVYLGLAPIARGRGLGAVLLSHGLHLAASVQARTVQLAVDIANAPAVALYRRAGFAARQQREAWVRPLSSDATCPQ